MCGLTVWNSLIYYGTIKPFVHLINYDSKRKDELLVILARCRHGLNLGIGGWMAGISESWTMFLAALFSCIDLTPGPGFFQSLMPKIFKETGHDVTDQLGDCL